MIDFNKSFSIGYFAFQSSVCCFYRDRKIPVSASATPGDWKISRNQDFAIGDCKIFVETNKPDTVWPIPNYPNTD